MKIDELVEYAKRQPEFQIGDVVRRNALGKASQSILDDNPMVVAAQSELIGRWCGDPSRTIEVWSLDDEGILYRQAVEPRLLELVPA